MVVVIVALLAACLLPALSHARRAAIRAQCAANLHQVGLAVATYSIVYHSRLPTHHVEPGLAFDTFAMSLSDGSDVNLGLLVAYTGGPAFYCPAQPADRSPDIAYDSLHNPWAWRRGPGEPQPWGPAPGPGGPPTPAGPNASYATRSRGPAGAAGAAWTELNYSNKVIYSDFIGVDDWPGGGRLAHGLRAPHDGEGYNRLFGDGSVLWATSERIHAVRPVGPMEPTPHELLEYYELLDVLP